MDRERVLSWTKAERLGLADFLDDLEGSDWEAPSLCTGWTVHDVVAHLTLSTRTTLPGMVKGMVRARGDWERMEFDAARRRAADFGPAELIAQFRDTAASTDRKSVV